MMPHCGSLVYMPLDALRSWLGLGAADVQESGPLRDTLEALDHLEPDRAKYLASFAYLMGRIAHADRHVSPEETRTMEALVAEHGQIPPDQAMLVVQLAKTNNRLFGATADFLVVAPPGELEQVQMDGAELKRAADDTRGRFYRMNQVERLLDDLPPGRQVPIETLPPETLWNKWWLLTAFLGLIVTEWILRKRKGML